MIAGVCLEHIRGIFRNSVISVCLGLRLKKQKIQEVPEAGYIIKIRQSPSYVILG